jgi:hypothetical protein
MQDPVSRKAIETQVDEFGQTPKQLFKYSHPKRYSNKISELLIEDDLKLIKLSINNEAEEINLKSIEETKINFLDENNKSIDNLPSTEEENLREINFNFDRNFTLLPKFHKK